MQIIGTIVDISRQKWAEEVQKRKMEDALEAKRQQENFIDMTSHEMRNPLSAIIHSADGIIESLSRYQIGERHTEDDVKELRETMDAAQTM